ncbi:MAG: hypothetical protein QM740_01785 [Acidovorax sp.]
MNDTAAELAARAQEFATRGLGYAQDATDRARRQLNDAADATGRYVAEQPGKSLLMAVVAGAAMGATVAALLSRRSRF